MKIRRPRLLAVLAVVAFIWLPTKRYIHIWPETQRRALEAVATEEVQATVNQIVRQAGSELESELRN